MNRMVTIRNIACAVLLLIIAFLFGAQWMWKHSPSNQAKPPSIDTVTVSVVVHDTVVVTKTVADLKYVYKNIIDTVRIYDSVRADSSTAVKPDSIPCWSVEENEADGAFIKTQMCSKEIPAEKPVDFSAAIFYRPGPDSLKRIFLRDTVTIQPAPFFKDWKTYALAAAFFAAGVFLGNKKKDKKGVNDASVIPSKLNRNF